MGDRARGRTPGHKARPEAPLEGEMPDSSESGGQYQPASERVRGLAEEVGRNLGMDVEDVELLGRGHRSLLRVVIDKAGGVSVEDCALFSRDFGALMDVEDPVRGGYTLEVSSPGLDRPLKRTRDYVKCIGKTAKLVLREPFEGQGFVVGVIKDADDLRVVLGIEADGREAVFARDIIKRARLEPELGKR